MQTNFTPDNPKRDRLLQSALKEAVAGNDRRAMAFISEASTCGNVPLDHPVLVKIQQLVAKRRQQAQFKRREYYQ